MVSQQDVASPETHNQDTVSNSSDVRFEQVNVLEKFSDSDHASAESFVITNPDGQEEIVGVHDPRVRDIPVYVRRIVSFSDDTTEPTITFRYFLLSIFFIVPGAFLSQMAQFRTTFAPYSIFFVQIASNYAGIWLAKFLPSKYVKVPFTRWSFSLNPGPFSTKEHVLVTISAASGATYNLGYTPIVIAELYFGHRINGAVAVFFMLAITWTGYSYAALARQFLIYDPQYPWFQALCQAALFETQKKQRNNPTRLSRKQMTVFFSVLAGVLLWQFLPEFIFPMLGSLAILCWVAPHNETANFIGAGFGGMGFLNLSLDWSNVGAYFSFFLTPWWTQVIIFAGFACSSWVLIPIAKFGNIGAKWNHQLMSNRVFLKNGTAYPLTELLTPDNTLNETAYAHLGELYVGPQFLWNTFFEYASYASALVWMGIFGWSQMKSSLSKYRQRRQGNNSTKITEQYADQINILQRPYDEIPLSWFVGLFLVSLIILVVLTAKNLLFIPLWTYFVAIGTGAIIVVPLAWLYALSNFKLVCHTQDRHIVQYGLTIF